MKRISKKFKFEFFPFPDIFVQCDFEYQLAARLLVVVPEVVVEGVVVEDVDEVQIAIASGVVVNADDVAAVVVDVAVAAAAIVIDGDAVAVVFSPVFGTLQTCQFPPVSN